VNELFLIVFCLIGYFLSNTLNPTGACCHSITCCLLTLISEEYGYLKSVFKVFSLKCKQLDSLKGICETK